MATLLLTAIGTALGGPLGGALGALVGQQVDGAIVGRRKIEGPRLKELSVQTSSYGSALPLHFGTIRASGSVIWSTELIEHKEKSGGGKGRPAVTSYSYTASFAVALGSRPIAGVGRIWADGNILRGAGGDMKVGGTLRVHTGHGDQPADPLLVQAEGAALNPAYRNLAYVVFEDLELADYGNRLPSLTFEIIADEGAVTAADVLGQLLAEPDVTGVQSLGLSGYTVDEGGVADVVATLSEIAPIACTVEGERLAFRLAEEAQGTVPALPLPSAGGDTAEEARASGWSRRREALPAYRQCAVRYYDIGRDYQPGLQRSIGRSSPGDVATIELPAAMTAGEASVVADRAARRHTIARDTLRYRISEIDRRLGPGAVVTTPMTEGLWRIEQWEWQADGVMLDLAAVMPGAPLETGGTDAGRANPAPDLLSTPSRIVAFELPWDGRGDPTTTAMRVAATSASAGWTGAALFAQSDDGQLAPLGSTTRRRSIVGRTLATLGPGTPLLFDARSTVDLELEAGDLALGSVTWSQLMDGANLALVGSEMIQFQKAERLSGNVWRLTGLLRGRGGTEGAVAAHAPAEDFALVDDSLTVVDPADLRASDVAIAAIGRGDESPAVSGIRNRGIAQRPLAPVHGRVAMRADGSLLLEWIRRTRGGWTWPDEVELPLNEPEEAWDISFATSAGSVLVWRTSSARLELTAAQVSSLAPGSGAHFEIRQIGKSARSLPLAVPLGS